MSTITNFHSINLINSLLRPLGLTVSSKQQIIVKTTMLALLQETNGLGQVEYRKYFLVNLTSDGVNYFLYNRTLKLLSGICTNYCRNNQTFYENCVESCNNRGPCADYCLNNPEGYSHQKCKSDCLIIDSCSDQSCYNETDLSAYFKCHASCQAIDYS